MTKSEKATIKAYILTRIEASEPTDSIREMLNLIDFLNEMTNSDMKYG